MQEVNLKMMFPYYWVRLKLNRIRNHHYHLENHVVADKQVKHYTWYDACSRAKKKLGNRSIRKIDVWAHLINSQRIKLVKRNVTSWQDCEYRLLEKVNSRELPAYDFPGSLWSFTASVQCHKISRNHKRFFTLSRKVRTDKSSWATVVGNAINRIRNLKDVEAVNPWVLCYEALSKKLNERFRSGISWDGCIYNIYRRVKRLG